MKEIKENTQMLLFRFRDYKNTDFINEHLEIIHKEGYVWMLKVGKKTSESKLQQILNDGGWLILRSPKSDGSKMYIAHFTAFQCEEPGDMVYPTYYSDIINQDGDSEYYSESAVQQWFRLEKIIPLSETTYPCFVLSKTAAAIDDVIKTTRTAVMFVSNKEKILF